MGGDTVPGAFRPAEIEGQGTQGVSGYDVVRSALGFVLLAASAAKGHLAIVGGVVETGGLNSRWVFAAVASFEGVFGLWLLSGRRPELTHRLGLGVFVLFGGLALAQALAGRATCHCFGAIPVTPWQALGFDCAAVLALAVWRPRDASCSRLGLAFFAPYVVGAAVILVVVGSWMNYRFGSVIAALARLRGDAMVVVPASLDLGKGELGQIRPAALELVNLTDQPITVIGWNSTGCVGIQGIPFTVSPRTERLVQVNFGFLGDDGPFTHRVLLYTNNKSQPALEFRFSGRIHVGE